MSSFGSLISVVSSFVFVFMMWEGLVSGRGLVGSCSMGSFLEWLEGVPPMNHTFNQLVLVYLV